MHLSSRTVLVKLTSQKSHPLSVLPVFKHQNQNLHIPIIAFCISFLFVFLETTIIKEIYSKILSNRIRFDRKTLFCKSVLIMIVQTTLMLMGIISK